MNPDTPDPQPVLMKKLKTTTAAPHAQLEATPFFEALMACQLPLESYVGQLRALTLAHSVLEPVLASCKDPAVASVWSDDMRKLPLLQSDLRYFEARLVADLREAVEQSQKLAETIRLRSLQEPLALLGYLYVLEGSTLGGKVMLSQFAKAFMLTNDGGLAYLSCYGPAVQEHWREFQKRMNALALSPEQQEVIITAAAEFFTLLGGLFQALYPFSPESKVFLVTSINPEAGRHAVPADAREIRASNEAGDICWERFPYFELRYGERGRRFARSDGAWLATLCQFKPAQISQQVRWLGRVLSTRGMPTLLLETKLEILFDRLAAAIPEKRSQYEKYLVAATELREARHRILDEAQSTRLAEEFNRAAGPEWSNRYRNAGELLVAAVADEQNGNTGTVASVGNWMTDPARFPSAWITAVQKTLNQANKLAETRCLSAPTTDFEV